MPKKVDLLGGHSIAFVDIDETFFHTFANVKVWRGKQLICELDNQEFNTYSLGDGERFDFGTFRNAKLFQQTSKPIPGTVKRVQSILSHVKRWDDGSRVVFLTARSDFDSKDVFLETFRKHGFNIDSRYVYVERSGNLKTGTVDEKKRKIVLEYIMSGHFRRVRMFDDNRKNLDTFLRTGSELPARVVDRARHYHGMSSQKRRENVIEFVGMLVEEGKPMRRIVL
jgi:predicted secreted acid phosphatase